MDNLLVASASSEAGSSYSETEELERFIDSYVLEYQVQGLLMDKTEGDGESEKTQSHVSQVCPSNNRDQKVNQKPQMLPKSVGVVCILICVITCLLASWLLCQKKYALFRTHQVISAAQLLHIASVAWCVDGVFPPNIQFNIGKRVQRGSVHGKLSQGSAPPRILSRSPNGSRKCAAASQARQRRDPEPRGRFVNARGERERPRSAADLYGGTWQFARGSLPEQGVEKAPRSRELGKQQGAENGNQESSLDMLGTDIWAANTFDSFSGATWDLQPEKQDFTQFHRKLQNTSKHPLPHIDREGLGKGKYKDSDGINLEKVLPVWQGYHPLSHEAEIAHTKKLFRRRRNNWRRQQRFPGGNKPQQHADNQQGGTKHNRDHKKLCQGGQAPHFSSRMGHHSYSQNWRWHHNQKHLPNNKETHRNAKETENLKIKDASVCMVHIPVEMHQGPEAVEKQSQQYIQELETKWNNSIHEHIGERPKINLLQLSKDRLWSRLKEKDEVTVETTNPGKNKIDKLIEILNIMRNNSSSVDSKLTTFMEEAQNSTNSEEMLGEIVKTIYQKAVTDCSFASTAAKLCDKMALFMVEGMKIRSLLLNMLQKDFTMREELQQWDVERWLGFITFLCEVFNIMRSSTGEPFRVLVCPIYTCLRECLLNPLLLSDAVLCCSMELQSTGWLLEEQLPEMMAELLAIARDKLLCHSESMLTQSLLLEVIELHANNWNPLTPTITQYYNKTIQKLTA
ncbi:LOW QUALITY PROTEIN: CBP80/20-dependent translation initiation factor-like [Podargus strigoides]